MKLSDDPPLKEGSESLVEPATEHKQNFQSPNTGTKLFYELDSLCMAE